MLYIWKRQVEWTINKCSNNITFASYFGQDGKYTSDIETDGHSYFMCTIEYIIMFWCYPLIYTQCQIKHFLCFHMVIYVMDSDNLKLGYVCV